VEVGGFSRRTHGERKLEKLAKATASLCPIVIQKTVINAIRFFIIISAILDVSALPTWAEENTNAVLKHVLNKSSHSN